MNTMLTMKQEYDELIAILTTILRFEAYPTRDLVVQLRQKFKITLKTKLRISHLHNMMEQDGVLLWNREFRKPRG